MKSKKKNEMEKAQNTKGAAQELDMDALEDVSGGIMTATLRYHLHQLEKYRRKCPEHLKGRICGLKK